MNDTICTDDIEKANLLNTHFKTRSDLNDTGKELPHITQSNPNNLSQLQTEPMEIRSILETLPTGKASGPDNIKKNYVLKSCSSMLSYSLSSLFNLTLPSSKVSQAWKEAKLMSLQYLKKDDLSDCKNYRPVSLVSTLGKVMEKSVHKHVLNFLNTNNVVTVSLPRGAMGLSAVCDCGISLSYSLTIFVAGDSTVN